jgi:phosphatidylserine/phosphatidylglycerophosphate/cardiolipin synthase-like enzyme
VAVFAAVIALVLAYGAVRINSVDKSASAAKKLLVGLVQVNRGAGQKHEDRDRFLHEHQEMSRKLITENSLDLIVWPEGVTTVNLRGTLRDGRIPPDALGNLGTPILFGTILSIDHHNETAGGFTAHMGIITYLDDKHAIAHNKIMIIDEEAVITGSFNFTKAAEEKNVENLLIIKSKDLAKIHIENWENHKKHSNKYERK